jgi:hypothetical protein
MALLLWQSGRLIFIMYVKMRLLAAGCGLRKHFKSCNRFKLELCLKYYRILALPNCQRDSEKNVYSRRQCLSNIPCISQYRRALTCASTIGGFCDAHFQYFFVAYTSKQICKSKSNTHPNLEPEIIT